MAMTQYNNMEMGSAASAAHFRSTTAKQGLVSSKNIRCKGNLDSTQNAENPTE
jgi:hypothetical protein